MSAASLPYGAWPDRPPAPGALPVVLRLPLAGSRALARVHTRQVAREVLSGWLGTTIDLMETERGPRLPPGSPGSALTLSFAYAGEVAWIGFHRGRRLGLDACPLADFPERTAVSALYLTPVSNETAEAFARRWASHEAALKWGGQGLTEGARTPQPPHRATWVADGHALAVAWD